MSLRRVRSLPRARPEIHHREILLGTSGAAFLGPFTQTVYAPSLGELQLAFAVNTLLINLTISLFTAIVAVSNFVVGPISDLRGRRAVLLPGLLVFAAGSAVCLLASSYGWFLAGRALQACGISAALVVAPAVIGDVYPPSLRGRAMSAYQTVSFMGPVAGPVVGGAIAAYLSWRWAFAVLVAAGLFAWAYNRRHLRETLPQGIGHRRLDADMFRTVLTNRSALAIVLIAFSQFYGYYVFLVFLPALLNAMHDFSSAVTGLFFVPLTAGMFLGIFVAGRWQRSWARTKILTFTSYGISFTVLLIWAALAARLFGIPVLIVLSLAYGLLLGCSVPVQSTILINLFTKEKGTAVGVYNFLRFAGAAAGPIVGGILEVLFGIEAVFLALTLLLAAAAVLIHRNICDPHQA